MPLSHGVRRPPGTYAGRFSLDLPGAFVRSELR